ncbi:hypothetical protein AVEN_134860-1 [Araneus ventricosus]|uniref:Uncharacterized protein n=1 Tax=Araneus ventricosus TaxID=182803 RepID=A0A4Y2K0V4_ARAVE|nr:hypothetical protein AVEN_134860-1 [Araneus ventricosus]
MGCGEKDLKWPMSLNGLKVTMLSKWRWLPGNNKDFIETMLIHVPPDKKYGGFRSWESGGQATGPNTTINYSHVYCSMPHTIVPVSIRCYHANKSLPFTH